MKYPTRIGRRLAVIAAIGATLPLAACTPSPTLISPLGKSLEMVQDAVPGANFTIYDLSEELTQSPPTYNDGSAPDLWIVVAACDSIDTASTANIPLAVLPEASMTDGIRQKAVDGEFRDLLEE